MHIHRVLYFINYTCSELIVSLFSKIKSSFFATLSSSMETFSTFSSNLICKSSLSRSTEATVARKPPISSLCLDDDSCNSPTLS